MNPDGLIDPKVFGPSFNKGGVGVENQFPVLLIDLPDSMTSDRIDSPESFSPSSIFFLLLADPPSSQGGPPFLLQGRGPAPPCQRGMGGLGGIPKLERGSKIKRSTLNFVPLADPLWDSPSFWRTSLIGRT